MRIHGISLQHFRNTTQQTFLFPQQTTVIVGQNARGKTSILEAIALLSTGESFRAEEVAEMIQMGQELGRVKGKIVGDDGEEVALELMITRGMLDGKKVQSRLYSVNEVRRRKKDFVGQFFTVAFCPEDLRLVEGSPGRRRRFMDTILAVTDPEYAVALKTYEDALKRRNRLLDQIQAGLMPETVLSYWTSLLIKHGQVLQEKRRSFWSFFPQVEFPVAFRVEYLPSVMSAERMEEYAARERAACHTLIGPHKDDFQVQIQNGTAAGTDTGTDWWPVHVYGSRGQQRLAVLWLKMGELGYVEKVTQARPILLLDDILSELDQEHRQQVIELMQTGQSLITTTEKEVVKEVQHYQPHASVIEL